MIVHPDSGARVILTDHFVSRYNSRVDNTADSEEIVRQWRKAKLPTKRVQKMLASSVSHNLDPTSPRRESTVFLQRTIDGATVIFVGKRRVSGAVVLVTVYPIKVKSKNRRKRARRRRSDKGPAKPKGLVQQTRHVNHSTYEFPGEGEDE